MASDRETQRVPALPEYILSTAKLASREEKEKAAIPRRGWEAAPLKKGKEKGLTSLRTEYKTRLEAENLVCKPCV